MPSLVVMEVDPPLDGFLYGCFDSCVEVLPHAVTPAAMILLGPVKGQLPDGFLID